MFVMSNSFKVAPTLIDSMYHILLSKQIKLLSSSNVKSNFKSKTRVWFTQQTFFISIV